MQDLYLNEREYRVFLYMKYLSMSLSEARVTVMLETGSSKWDIAKVLGISYRGVNKAWERARKKLEAEPLSKLYM